MEFFTEEMRIAVIKVWSLCKYFSFYLLFRIIYKVITQNIIIEYSKYDRALPVFQQDTW